jgi:SNF2 family DNA or RNA helicase
VNDDDHLNCIAISADHRLIASNATLIVAPASVIYQWEKEMEKWVRAGRLDVLMFHGPKRERNAKRYRFVNRFVGGMCSRL